MKAQFVEAGNGFNWGKFLVVVFGPEDAAYRSALTGLPLLREIGWWDVSGRAWVFVLQTGEGAYFALGGYVKADLAKHRVWVCPLFEPFLTWLYEHGVEDLPAMVELPEAEAAFFGYRREGLERLAQRLADAFDLVASGEPLSLDQQAEVAAARAAWDRPPVGEST